MKKKDAVIPIFDIGQRVYIPNAMGGVREFEIWYIRINYEWTNRIDKKTQSTIYYDAHEVIDGILGIPFSFCEDNNFILTSKGKAKKIAKEWLEKRLALEKKEKDNVPF